MPLQVTGQAVDTLPDMDTELLENLSPPVNTTPPLVLQVPPPVVKSPDTFAAPAPVTVLPGDCVHEVASTSACDDATDTTLPDPNEHGLALDDTVNVPDPAPMVTAPETTSPD